MDPVRDHTIGPPSARAPRVTPQVVLGLLVIVVGVLFTLDNLGIVDASTYLRYWPAGLILIGLAKIGAARGGRGTLGGIVWTVIGAWLLLDTLDVAVFDLSLIVPIALVLIGVHLVWRGMTAGGRRGAPDTDAHISALAVMSGVARRSSASPFLGADLTAVMGGCEIDLSGATLGTDAAIIDVFAFWGGIDLRVPEDWTVVSQVTPFMGSLEDKTRTVPAAGLPRTRLIIRGLIVMGGVVVKN
ncbi:MAG TPA: DUF5668 domain-containing protein [Vicinamibacterales bacterium]|nr:DUF5668 domain-containing protein [Vicinamibacterales bacterium]